MVEHDGNCTERNMIRNFKKYFIMLFAPSSSPYHLVEGVYAHQYYDAEVRDKIVEAYNKRYNPEPTPLTHPERFNPLNPPQGWVYDPFYEIWIEFK